MIIFLYFVLLSIAVFAIGISGILASRHFIIMMLSMEVALSASTLLAMALFYFVQPGNIILLLFAIWSVASTEVLGLVVLYRHIVKYEVSLDISKLSRLKN